MILMMTVSVVINVFSLAHVSLSELLQGNVIKSSIWFILDMHHVAVCIKAACSTRDVVTTSTAAAAAGQVLAVVTALAAAQQSMQQQQKQQQQQHGVA
jgi:hypothetical protein